LPAILFFFWSGCTAQPETVKQVDYEYIQPGATNFEVYLTSIQNKNVALVAHPASVLNGRHLVDTLLTNGIRLVKIFSPEHGFRGNAEAGEKVKDGTDPQTGLPVISLYGDHKKPTREDLSGVDVLLVDLQGVGVRFYTYISTLTYVMEACAENNVPVIVLDRPNPNGFYVDGPVLEPEFSSFVGMHPVPVVYGMTIGEYALMVNGESWLKNDVSCELTVVQMHNYSHDLIVKLPVSPSPNLPNWLSVYLYPSLCFFEGTIMSVGRGTDVPFQIYGHPDFVIGSYAFTPESMPGKSLHPKFEGKLCYGQNLTGYAENYSKNQSQLNLTWLIAAYELLSPKHSFFTDYFNKLAGTDKLRKQIEAGMSEKEIRATWEKDLKAFKKIREKYLLYD